MAGNRINVILGLDTSGFMRSINQVERSLGKMSQTLQNAGASLTQSLTLPLGAVAVAVVAAAAAADLHAVDAVTGADHRVRNV